MRRRQSKDLVRVPRLDILAFEFLKPRPFVRRQAGPPADVTLGLPHQLRSVSAAHPIFLGDRGDRRPLRRVVLAVLDHHPHRSLAHETGSSRNDPILSRTWSLR
jgi:hypothetical protein